MPAIAVRADFRPLALFAPALRTDAQGRARTELKLPDSLTRYRVMAVGIGGAKYYGQGESSITARMPLAVKPAAPRFLNFGDRVELPPGNSELGGGIVFHATEWECDDPG